MSTKRRELKRCAEMLRAQHVVLRPHKSSRKVSGFRVNPVTQQPFGMPRLSKLKRTPGELLDSVWHRKSR